MITGRGRYTEDINLPGTLHAAIVRSPEAHADIVSIDVSAAREHAGVVAVLTGEDMADDFVSGLASVWNPPGVEVRKPDHWPLKRGQVKHVGDPVAVVVAASREAAVDAAEEVIVEYDPKPAVIDPERALEDGAPLVWEGLGTNETHQWSVSGGDIDAALGEADVTITRRFVNHRTSGAPIEPRCSIARATRGRPDPLLHDTDSPHRPLHPRLDAQRPGGQAARRRSGCRRRLRRQAPGVRRGGARARARQASRPPGEVDRDALRAHDHEPPRPRPDQHDHARREERRHDHRLQGGDHRRPGRLHAAAHALHPDARLPCDGRLLQVAGDRHHDHRRLHQQDVHRRHPRRRAAGGDLLDRAGDGRPRGRARDGPARAAAQELHPQG